MTDVVSFGSDKPPWRPSRRLVAAAGAVLLAGVAGWAVIDRDPGPAPAPAASSPALCRPVRTESPAGPPVAVVIDGSCGAAAGIERRDFTAAGGPWSVIVRRSDGSLGRHGAVVTFPAGASGSQGGAYVWELAGKHALIRGDLPAADLRAIAGRVTLVGGRPSVRPPAGFRVVWSGSYWPSRSYEVRYGSAEVGETAALGDGLTTTWTGSGAAVEDLLFQTGRTDAEPVGGRPAVVSGTLGGNGALVWEPAPGVVSYVGWSGASMSDATVAALRRLAARARGVDPAGWQALRPQIIEEAHGRG